jgi:hypothetical protein
MITHNQVELIFRPYIQLPTPYKLFSKVLACLCQLVLQSTEILTTMTNESASLNRDASDPLAVK